MRIAVGSDHAGVSLRRALMAHLREGGHQVDDLGPVGGESVDYPDYAEKVARAVSSGDAERGVLVCGTGAGMSMATNRVAGVRAALCTNEYVAR